MTSAAAPSLDIRPLSPAIGVEVGGVDLAGRLDEAVFGQIRAAWEESCIALFRGQTLSETRQILFARRFGKLGEAGGGPRPVLYVTNARNERGEPGILPEGPIDFHSDQSYLEEPSMATMLYAIDVPGRGGNTLFANGFRAYDALPDELKRRLAGRSALHAYDYYSNPNQRAQRAPPGATPVAHPIFRVHPPTGRTALYVNRLMTWSIVDMDPDESDRILHVLFDHQEKAEFVYEHAWTPRDLIVWDNRSCLHGRTDFAQSALRRLRRVTVLGERPIG
ncbi:MAG: TauD/TfdA family dioxygenase [Caulobacteraceae bacterium]